jgi:hypothetical protein
MLTGKLRKGGPKMESFVNWWCHLIGITDTMAIQVATGVVGGGLALLIALILWTIAMVLFEAIVSRISN